MTKMREAFIRLYGAELLSALSGSQFEAGYQAAIADVKAGGPKAYIYPLYRGERAGSVTFVPPKCQDPDQMADQEVVVARLYKLPED